MIYTVTLNPSIDYIVRVEDLKLGRVNRMVSDDKFPGGKGINVSRTLARLGYQTKALGFIGGFTGNFVEEELSLEGIQVDFVRVDQDTRINIKVKGQDETEINGVGPEIHSAALANLKSQLAGLSQEDVVVFAGSAPANLSNEIYQELIPLVKASGAQFVCDFEGENLVSSLVHQPLLVKPNNHELGAIFNVTLAHLKDIVHYGQLLLDKGAQHVLVSMAGEGALLISPTATYYAKPISGQVKNSVGAGDSMVAGFTGSFQESHDPVTALKWGVACGSATAFSDDLATKEFIDSMYQKVEVEKI